MSRRMKSQPAYAVVRVDQAGAADDPGPNILVPGFTVTVKEVVLDRAVAEAEVARLSGLNADARCSYHWQSTHLVLDGGSLGAEPASARWALWRQDDNGNQFLVSAGHTQEEATALLEVYEARQHKQMYWISQDPKGAA